METLKSSKVYYILQPRQTVDDEGGKSRATNYDHRKPQAEMVCVKSTRYFFCIQLAWHLKFRNLHTSFLSAIALELLQASCYDQGMTKQVTHMERVQYANSQALK